MNKVKLGLKKLSAEQLIQYIRQIIKNLLGNIYFTSTTPASATVTTAINDYETALNNEKTAYETAKSMTATAHQKRIALELITNQLGNFIENASGGDAAKIKSTGMDIKASPVHHTGVPFKPTGMAASAEIRKAKLICTGMHVRIRAQKVTGLKFVLILLTKANGSNAKRPPNRR
jgi:hypothetical protein